MAVQLKRDDQHRCCGYLELETPAKQGTATAVGGKSYERYFFVLDTEQNQFLYYADDPKYTNHELVGSFNILYMSMVEDAASFKSQNPLCLVLTERGTPHYLKARNDEEKKAWIKELQNSAKIKTKRLTMSQSDDSSYEGSVITAVKRSSSSEDRCAVSDSESEREDNEFMKKYAHSNFAQRPLKTGYCTKQGIFIKTWKRRWFVLAEAGLAYYRSHEEKSPIRVVPSAEMLEARRSIGIHMGRDNLFEVVTASRVFYIQAESSYDCDDWIREIKHLLNPTRRKSEAIIQTDHSGTLGHNNNPPSSAEVKHRSTPKFFYV